MPAPYATFEDFWAEQGRCGTCIWFENLLFGGHCSLPRNAGILEDRDAYDNICGEYWDPIPSVDAELEAVVELEMSDMDLP